VTRAHVFLSYARAESAQYAGALHASLESAGIPAFLDSSDIEAGGEFLVRMIDELLDSTITVLFVGQVYFTRQACRRECEAALAALDIHFASDRDKPRRTAGAVRHIVVAYPPGGSPSLFENVLPRSLTQISWLPADQTGALANLILDRIGRGRRPLPIPPVQRARIREQLTAESDYAFELELDGSLHAAKAVMESAQRRLGRDDSPSKDSVRATWTLARILWKLGEVGATDLTEKACRDCEAVYGAGHPRCEELRRLARSRVRAGDAGRTEPGIVPDAG